MHLFGTCGDAHAHLDLMDFLLMGGIAPVLLYTKYKWQIIKSYINVRIKKGSRRSTQ
jgi:hypothetical protein